MGNLRSVAQALRAAAPEADVQVVDRPEAIRAADRVVLPGQGAMPDCMGALGASGLQEAVLEAAASKPMLGVCVGEQMLFDRSTESRTGNAATPCSALMPGEVVRFELEGLTQPDGSRFKVPADGLEPRAAVARAPALAGHSGRELVLFRPQLLCARAGCGAHRG